MLTENEERVVASKPQNLATRHPALFAPRRPVSVIPSKATQRSDLVGRNPLLRLFSPRPPPFPHAFSLPVQAQPLQNGRLRSPLTPLSATFTENEGSPAASAPPLSSLRLRLSTLNCPDRAIPSDGCADTRPPGLLFRFLYFGLSTARRRLCRQ